MNNFVEDVFIAKLFYMNPSISSCEIHLVVIRDIEAHRTVSDWHLCINMDHNLQ